MSNDFGQSKRMHDIRITPETMCPGASNCFTINPKDQPSNYEDGHLIGSVQQWADAIKRKFRTLRYCNAKIFLEISREGRLHFHGNLTVREREIGHFFAKDIPILCGIGAIKLSSEFVKDKNSKYETWQDYCDKQKEIILTFVAKENIERNWYITNSSNPKDHKLHHV